MFIINKNDKSIYCTRGDVGVVNINISTAEGEVYTFSQGDVIRFRIMPKNDCTKTILLKDVKVLDAATSVQITLTKEDTTIGEVLSKPVDYWYEMELNPETNPQTFIGYDAQGPKIFKLFPEGGE